MNNSINNGLLELLTTPVSYSVGRPERKTALPLNRSQLPVLTQEQLVPGQWITVHHMNRDLHFDYLVMTPPYSHSNCGDDSGPVVRVLHGSKARNLSLDEIHEAFLSRRLDVHDTEEYYLSSMGVVPDPATGHYHEFNYATLAEKLPSQ